MKSKVLLSSPGKFEPAEVHALKRWIHVEHLANEFWADWRKEYLLSLQGVQKWTLPRRNLHVGGIVMIKDTNLPHNAWQLPSRDGQVCKVQVSLADACQHKKVRRSRPMRYLKRTVQIMVLLVPSCDKRLRKSRPTSLQSTQDCCSDFWYHPVSRDCRRLVRAACTMSPLRTVVVTWPYHPVSRDHGSLIRAARSQPRTMVVIFISLSFKLPWVI